MAVDAEHAEADAPLVRLVHVPGIANASSATAVQTKTSSVWLVAEDAPQGLVIRIHDGVAAVGLSLRCFGCIADLRASGDASAPSAIVLWVDDVSPAVTNQVRELAASLEGVPVVLVCRSVRRWEIRAALAGGVAGVVLFDDELSSSLGPCLQAVRTGQVCVPRGHGRQIEPPALSAREKQVLSLVVTGCMNSQIAERLFLAESTVKSHLSSAFGKLGVRSRNEAATLILDPEMGLGIGILDLDGAQPETVAGAVR